MYNYVFVDHKRIQPSLLTHTVDKASYTRHVTPSRPLALQSMACTLLWQALLHFSSREQTVNMQSDHKGHSV